MTVQYDFTIKAIIKKKFNVFFPLDITALYNCYNINEFSFS